MMYILANYLTEYRSLLAKFLLIFFPLTLIVVSVSTIYVAVLDYRAATEAVAYKQQESAKTISRALALPLWNFDIETAENIVAGLVVDQDVISAELIDDKGETVTRKTAKNYEEISDEKLFVSQIVTINDGGAEYEIAALKVEYTNERLQKALNTRIITTVTIVVLLLITNILAALLALRVSVTIPLSKITEAVKQSNDKILAEAEWQSKDEIGDLIETYNAMVLEVNENRKILLDSITFASLIQNSYLPTGETSNLDSHVIWKPRDVVSGDIFFWDEEEDISTFVVLDCTGHGVPGSILAGIARSAFVNSDLLRSKPGKILTEVNEFFTDMFEPSRADKFGTEVGFDCSICRIRKGSAKIEYAGARNSIFILKEDKIAELKVDRRSIGQTKNGEFEFNSFETELDHGYIVMLTDGVIDAVRIRDKPTTFGKKRFSDAIKVAVRGNKTSPSKINESVMSEVESWVDGEKLRDDLTLLTIEK